MFKKAKKPNDLHKVVATGGKPKSAPRPNASTFKNVGGKKK